MSKTMKKFAGAIDLTPSWVSLAPVIIDRLLDNNDKKDVWKNIVIQTATIADEFTRLVKQGKITKEDTNLNISKIKVEVDNES